MSYLQGPVWFLAHNGISFMPYQKIGPAGVTWDEIDARAHGSEASGAFYWFGGMVVRLLHKGCQQVPVETEATGETSVAFFIFDQTGAYWSCG